MRIGIVINTSWNIYNFRKGLVDKFLGNGHQVVAISPPDDYSEKLSEWGCEYVPVDIYSKSTNPFYDLKLVIALAKIYRSQRLDVVLHFTIKPNIYGSLAAAMVGIPSINNVTGLGTVFIRENKRSKIAKMLYRFAFRYPKVVFFQNNDDRALFIAKKLVKKSLTDVLPGSGIDLNRFVPSHTNRASGKPFCFLMVARLLFDKGIMEFVEAARALRSQGINARFQVLGAIEPVEGLGVQQSQVDTWCQEGLIEHLGKVEDVRPLVANADCVVLPSYREGTPRSLIEASSMGKPIVTTDVAGCRETVIEGYNGFFCQSCNATDLTNKMLRMYLLSVEERSEMGSNSRKLATDRFDQEKVIQKYASAIHFALSGKKTEQQSIVQSALRLSSNTNNSFFD